MMYFPLNVCKSLIFFMNGYHECFGDGGEVESRPLSNTTDLKQTIGIGHHHGEPIVAAVADRDT